MNKRILACIVCLCVAFSTAPTIVFAAEERVTSINDNGFRVWSDDGKEFINRTSSTEGNVVVVDQAGNYNVTGSTTSYRIEIRITDETKAGTVTIYLQGATIKPSTPGAAIGVAKECAEGTNVTIVLFEKSINEVFGKHHAGIISSLGRKLEIVGNGTLNTTGDVGYAGIVGDENGNSSNINISDQSHVNITCNGGAGIFGGMRGNGSNITICGSAKVNATGAMWVRYNGIGSKIL